jgi:hypothetical protein
MKIKVSTLAIIALPLAACVGNTQAPTGQPALGSASDLSAFQGARAGQAEMGIQNLGYELIRTQGLTQYWFNRSTGACAELKVGDGRYQSVRMLPADDC